MGIITPTSTLRDWTPDDACSLAWHANNPRIAAMMRDAFPSPYTLEDAHRFISMATGPTPNLLLAIEVMGEAVGGIGIHPLVDVKRRSAEIGYWLSDSFRGKGIMTDAVRSLVPIAFKRYDIVRLQAGIFSNNPASMRVWRSAGLSAKPSTGTPLPKTGLSLTK